MALNSVVGFFEPRTVKMLGTIRGRQVVILIDGGAQCTIFLAKVIAEELQHPIAFTAAYGVRLRDGKSIQTMGLCKGVNLTLQGVEVREGFIPMELGSTDVILRVKWLRILGGTYFNYDSHVMKFRLGNTTITLRGHPSLEKSIISLKNKFRELQWEKTGYIVQIKLVEVACHDLSLVLEAL